MATNNFYSKSRIIFAIQVEDDFIIDDTKENIFCELLSTKGISVTKESEYDYELRSYGGEHFARVTDSFSDDDLYAETVLTVRSGYYSGANFDFETRVYDSYSGEYIELEYLDEDTIRESLEGYHDKKPTKTQVNAKLKQLHEEVDKLEKTVQQTYKQFTTPLIKVAQFSNGEAVYESKILRG